MAMAILTSINFQHGKYSGCSLKIVMRLFYIILTILHGEMGDAQIVSVCNGAQYTDGSEFESNLETVLKNLAQQTSQTGFNTSVYGQCPDQISGLLQCRGDTTVDQCYHCSQLATTNIKQYCGNGIGARLLFDFCYLRYENYSFIGSMGDNGMYINVTANATNPSVSIAVLVKLLFSLSAEAASAMKRCAFGTAIDSWPRKIYRQAECTRDISTDDCTTCLSDTINNIIVTVYPGYQSVVALVSSCIVRYDINSFFNLAAIAIQQPPAEAPAETPPKQIKPLSPHIHQSKKLVIILSVIGGFIFVLYLCLFATWRRLKSYEGDGKVEEHTLMSQNQNQNQNQQVTIVKMETSVAAPTNFLYDNNRGEGGFVPT